MLHQAIKKWMLLPSGLCSLFLILLAVGVVVKRNEPLTFPVVKSLFVLLVIAAYGIVEIMNYYVWYFQSKKSIAMNGKCCSAKRADLIHTVSEFLLSIFIIGNIFFFDQITVFEMVFFTGISIFFLIHAAWIKRLCKYVGCPAVANRIITIVGSVILSFYCSVWVWQCWLQEDFCRDFRKWQNSIWTGIERIWYSKSRKSQITDAFCGKEKEDVYAAKEKMVGIIQCDVRVPIMRML